MAYRFPTRFPRSDPRTVLRLLERSLVDPLLPPCCLHCGGRAGGSWWPHLCRDCAGGLASCRRWLASGEAPPLFALWLHRGASRSLLHALKYRGATRVGRRVGVELARASGRLLREAPPGLELVGIPLHWARRWRRGHDQVRALLDGMRMEVPWLPVGRPLRRRRRTRSQVGLSPAERRRNLAGAFRPRRASLTGRSFLLVDDVVTTGATLTAAADALRGAGGRVVAALAVAVPDRTGTGGSVSRACAAAPPSSAGSPRPPR